MLRDDIARYTELSGNDGEHTPIGIIGAFLDGYEMGLKGRPKGEWIPVSERLPKIADVYRVTRYYSKNVMNPKYIVDACFFDGSDIWYNDNRINHERGYADNVIAWQENPEPYKAEKGGE